MNKKVRAGTFLCGIVASGLVMADCDKTMPLQLFEDCLVYEGAGSSFPTSDYAHMDQYQAWIKTQQSDQQIAKSQLNASAK